MVGLLDDLDRRVVRPVSARPATSSACSASITPGPRRFGVRRLAGADLDDRPPGLDLGRERALQAFIDAAAQRPLASAQDVSGGGLAITIAEGASGRAWGPSWLSRSARRRPWSSSVRAQPRGRVDDAEHWDRLAVSPRAVGCRWTPGHVGGDRLHIRLIGLAATGAAEERGAGVADDVDVPVGALEHAWTAGLPRALGEEA